MAREPSLPNGGPSFANLGFVEQLYQDWLADPASVDEAWRVYFAPLGAPSGAGAGSGQGTAGAASRPPASASPAAPGAAHPAPPPTPERLQQAPASQPSREEAFQFKVDLLVEAYRERGHLYADLDPLGLERRSSRRIALESFGLSEADLERPVANDAGGDGARTLRDLVARLEETYCRTIGVELAHLHDVELRRWLRGADGADAQPPHPHPGGGAAPARASSPRPRCSSSSSARASWGRSASRWRGPRAWSRCWSWSSTGRWDTG